MPKIAIFNFYSFTEILDINFLQARILWIARRKLIKGTLILSKEGFNAAISGSYDDCLFLMDFISDSTQAQNVVNKINYSKTHPFEKLKVKLKNEIVKMGVNNLNIQNTGEYIEPQMWDSFISNPEVITIDTRNDYEVEKGTFEGSVNPQTQFFRDFPKWAEQNKDSLHGKKVAMFCTGGIRCEKSTAYLKSLGINDVYHLRGGILQYLDDTKNHNKLWRGECIVFDERKAVNEDLNPIM